MKHFSKRAAAAALALVMGLTPLAMASEAMGNEIQKGVVDLSVGTNLTKQIFWSDTYSDLRQERFFTYTPNQSVTPVVAYGDKVTTRATLTAMAQNLEKQGKRVVGGINGDFYVMATGQPLGLVITDGILRTTPEYDVSWAVGFRADGTAFIGRPEMSVIATLHTAAGTEALQISGGINKVRDAKRAIHLYTEDFNATTMNTEAGVDVILAPVLDNVGQSVTVDIAAANAADHKDSQQTLTQSARPIVGGRVTYKVEQIIEATGATAIPAGKVVLSINTKTEYQYQVERLRALQVGDTVDIDVATGADTRWVGAVHATGAQYKLVSSGKVETGLPTERTSRSAIGIKPDGSVVFYTMDGSQPGYSIGTNFTQVAQRLVELGCTEAVGLDGGGSTTIGATTPDGSGLGVLNKPSDGSQRANSTAIFLTTDMKANGELGSFYVTPSDGLLLAGAKVQLNALALDTHYYPLNSSVPYTWSATGGTVDDSGAFIAGASAGVGTVTATAEGGTAKGSAALTVVTKPDTITITNESSGAALPSLAVSPKQVVDLKASSTYKKLNLVSQDNCYTWSADPAIGTIDQNGLFTAAAKDATGNITVSAGGTSVTVSVTIAGQITSLDGFESGVTSFTAAGSSKISVETLSEYVKYGKQSMRFDYDTSAAGTASAITTLTIKEGEQFLSLWVYGDGSQNSLTATLADTKGATTEVVLTGLDFKGWKQITVPLPADSAAIRTLNIISGGGSATGTIWIDKLTTANEELYDTVAPVLTTKVKDGTVIASVVDNIDKKFTASQVAVTYDGKALNVTFDAATGMLKATLPSGDGKLHRVSVTATDASGNIGRGAVNIDATGTRTPVFADMKTHWAADFATYLYDQGVTTGIPDDKTGNLNFQPDKAITRGEFFAMVARWMKVDLTKYATTTLPFTDVAKIPDWALPSVKAMYALGILKGSDDGKGNLTVNVGSTISRAEAMTILGRSQAKGYTEVALSFTDAAKVPDWAAPYVKTLVGQGVVNGAEGNKILPNDPVQRGQVAKMLFTMT